MKQSTHSALSGSSSSSQQSLSQKWCGDTARQNTQNIDQSFVSKFGPCLSSGSCFVSSRPSLVENSLGCDKFWAFWEIDEPEFGVNVLIVVSGKLCLHSGPNMLTNRGTVGWGQQLIHKYKYTNTNIQIHKYKTQGLIY